MLDKKIYFISPRDMFKGKVGAIMIMQTCNSLKNFVTHVTLITPTVRRAENVTKKELWEHYNLRTNAFSIVSLPTLLTDQSSDLNVKTQKFLWHSLYGIKIFFEALFSPRDKVVIISRCFISTYPYLIILWPLRKLKKILFIYELHYYKDSFNYKYIINHMDGLIVISHALKNVVVNQTGFPKNKIVIGRMGVNLDNYGPNGAVEDIRKLFNINSPSHPIVVYTGKLAKNWKEIRYIIEAAKQLPEINFILVGGKPQAVLYWDKECQAQGIKNVHFTGFIAPGDVVKYQKSADVLIMYYDSGIITKEYASPGKMMEYMASGRPIVSVDFPVFREVLEDGKNAILIPPDQPYLLAKKIRALVSDTCLSKKLATQAKNDVIQYSWNNRAKNIISLILTM